MAAARVGQSLLATLEVSVLRFVVLLAACGGEPVKNTPPKPAVEQVPAAPAAQAPTPDLQGAEAVVRGLYEPYLNGDGGPGLERTGAASASLQALLDAYNKKVEERGEPGDLNYDVIANAQDYKLSELSLKSSGGPDKATVVATFKNYDAPVTVTYDLVLEGGAWKVDNVNPGDEGADIRKILSAP